MLAADFDFELPSELIAQAPTPERDRSRLLVLHRGSRRIEHRRFCDLVEYLRPGDVLVLNNSRVIPARLRGSNTRTGGQFEILLLEEMGLNDWWVMLRPGKRARVGTQITLRDRHSSPTQIQAGVIGTNEEGHRRVRFTGTANIAGELQALGEVPLPPYIARPDQSQAETDRERYQTVFAQAAGSVAAPTAGLHFTEAMIERIRAHGVHVCFLTLHVGLGTFAPVKAERIAAHVMHEERYELSEDAARVINLAKAEGRRVIATGTTTVRVLETLAARHVAAGVSPAVKDGILPPGPAPEVSSVSDMRTVFPPGGTPGSTAGGTPAATVERDNGALICPPPVPPAPLPPGVGKTRIFIYPPYKFRCVDVLLTNFHLPRSTLLMLVSAFAAPNETRGRNLILDTYAEAVRERYRFFSYGDAMFIL